jgi:hypothetical protein
MLSNLWNKQPTKPDFNNSLYEKLVPAAKSMIDELQELVQMVEKKAGSWSSLTDVREFENLACGLLYSYQERKSAIENFSIPLVTIDIQKADSLDDIEKEKFFRAFAERKALVQKKRENFNNLKSSLELIKIQYENIFLYLTTMYESLCMSNNLSDIHHGLANKIRETEDLLNMYGQ